MNPNITSTHLFDSGFDSAFHIEDNSPSQKHRQNPVQGFMCLAKDCPVADVQATKLLKEHLNQSIKLGDASHIWFYEQNKIAIDTFFSKERINLIAKMKTLVVKNLSKWEPYTPQDQSDSTKNSEPLDEAPTMPNGPASEQVLNYCPRKERSSEGDHTCSLELNIPGMNEDERSDPNSGPLLGLDSKFILFEFPELNEFPEDSDPEKSEKFRPVTSPDKKRKDSFASSDFKRQKRDLSSLDA